MPTSRPMVNPARSIPADDAMFLSQKRLHQRIVKNTMIHVTQKQIEAMTLADRIALIPVISYSASMARPIS